MGCLACRHPNLLHPALSLFICHRPGYQGRGVPQVQKATEGRDEAQRCLDAAATAVEAAARELAGAEAGDGRDESNRSLQERLADTQRAQVSMPALPPSC